MENIYDEIEIDDLDFDDEEQNFQYPCPCGDKFRISVKQLRKGELIATCPSCSLQIKVIYELEEIEEFF